MSGGGYSLSGTANEGVISGSGCSGNAGTHRPDSRRAPSGATVTKLLRHDHPKRRPDRRRVQPRGVVDRWRFRVRSRAARECQRNTIPAGSSRARSAARLSASRIPTRAAPGRFPPRRSTARTSPETPPPEPPSACHYPPTSQATPREQQVIDALLVASSNRAIAERLGIGEQSVKNRLTGVYKSWAIEPCRNHFVRTKSRPQINRRPMAKQTDLRPSMTAIVISAIAPPLAAQGSCEASVMQRTGARRVSSVRMCASRGWTSEAGGGSIHRRHPRSEPGSPTTQAIIDLRSKHQELVDVSEHVRYGVKVTKDLKTAAPADSRCVPAGNRQDQNEPSTSGCSPSRAKTSRRLRTRHEGRRNHQ